jgi:acetyl esterase/lipase
MADRRRLWALGALLLASAAALLLLVSPRAALWASSAAWPFWVQTDRDIAYGPSPEQRLDVMRPRSPASKLRPAVVVFHGGGWVGGSRDEMWYRVCRRYLRQGFVVANVDYRYGIAPASADACAALEWVSRNAARYSADTGRIVLAGDSAGGHLALLTAFTCPAPVAAVVNFYGVADLTAPGLDSLWRSLPSLRPPDNPELFSPLKRAPRRVCPVLSIHGAADTLVPPSQTEALTARLLREGNPAEQILIDGAGHGFSPRDADLAYRAVFEFLDRRLAPY